MISNSKGVSLASGCFDWANHLMSQYNWQTRMMCSALNLIQLGMETPQTKTLIKISLADGVGSGSSVSSNGA